MVEELTRVINSTKIGVAFVTIFLCCAFICAVDNQIACLKDYLGKCLKAALKDETISDHKHNSK